MDSGASEHVIPPSTVDHIRLDDGPKKGCEYEVADGGAIENFGERRCLVADEYSNTINRIDLQVTDVHKPLLSVAKMIDAGKRVVFDAKGSYVEDAHTRERIPLERKGASTNSNSGRNSILPRINLRVLPGRDSFQFQSRKTG